VKPAGGDETGLESERSREDSVLIADEVTPNGSGEAVGMSLSNKRYEGLGFEESENAAIPPVEECGPDEAAVVNPDITENDTDVTRDHMDELDFLGEGEGEDFV
jgi:hypothetical protein